jgi:hypothetical protein
MTTPSTSGLFETAYRPVLEIASGDTLMLWLTFLTGDFSIPSMRFETNFLLIC